MRTLVLTLFAALTLSAAEHRGQVQFNGLPLPGATVTASQGDKKLVAITEPDGKYFFPDIPDGTWNFDVEMLCFAPVKQEVTLAAGTDVPAFDLKLLQLDQIKTFAAPPPPPPDPARISVTSQTETPTPAATQTATAKPAKGKKGAPPPVPPGQNSFQRAAVNANPNAAPPAAAQSAASEAIPANSSFANQNPSDLSKSASDGLLINGTVNNGASTPYAQSAAFGNNRRGPGSLYTGMVGMILDNSALDARSYSYTGQNTPKPGYEKFQGIANFGGPIRIPHLIQNGPIFFVAYNWTRNHTANTNSYLVPTAAQRTGDLSAFAPVYDPTTGAPFPGNVIPANRISPQAAALLNFYPQPNFPGSTLYNYQVPIVGETHQDSMQTRLNKNIGNKNQLWGTFAFQRTAVDAPNLFGFLDKTSTLGSNTQLNWSHRMSQRMFAHFQVTFSRMSTTLLPNFANKENVSGNAGINGNAQDPLNWGPPFLQFTSITGLTDGTAAVNHNQTTAYSYDGLWNYGRHNITYGADLKRVDFNSISQQNPRGTFTFTGAATGLTNTPLGNDFADFLLGTPDTAKLAFGNADKYFRSTLYDAFFNDDWRVGPALTLLAGVRWEYSSPITELYGRLVNLDVASGYSNVAPVVANNPSGSLTGIKYPDSLVHPDKTGFEPRLGLAWRPIPASSLVVRAGYGVYYNTSVYQSIATQMAQQAPLSKSLSIQNTPTTPLTLANGFNARSALSSDIFGIDPNFRVGYAQNWKVSVQRDLPGSLVVTGTYLGIKGTRGPQQLLPNTYPVGGVNPCPACPSGFIYEASNGNSTRESGQLQLRRRLRAGFTASIDYTFSKSIDDSALGGGVGGVSVTNVIAQNWLNLSAEKALSNFDQRHLIAFQMQYTTGQGLGGGTLLSGWRGTAFKEWTVVTTINAGSGLPLNPFILAPAGTTGVTGSIRPNYTGAPLYSNLPPGYDVNPAAFVQAPAGRWGNAGRNTITGPDQFTMNASLRRTFRLKDRYSLDVNVDATNVLNHVTFTAYNVLVNSPQFGLPSPTAINAMRVLQTTVRVRF